MSTRPNWIPVYSTDEETLYRDDTGTYTEELEIRQESDDSPIVAIYRFTLDRCKVEEQTDDDGTTHRYLVPYAYDASWSHPVHAYEEWFADDLADVARSIDVTRDDLVAQLCSEDARARASAYVAIGGYHGYENLDSYPTTVMSDDYVSDFTEGYIACAMWCGVMTETDGDLESVSDADDSLISDTDRETIERDCRSFCDANAHDLAALDPEQCGHDFYLTRNGHGAGFWDRGLGAIGERLTDACRPYGTQEFMLWTDDNGEEHMEMHD